MDYSVQLKEAVELIESRLPGGKWLTRIALFLVVAVVILASFLYVWNKALLPLSHAATALVTGTTFTYRITFGDVLVWLISLAASWAVYRLFKRMAGMVERVLRLLHSNMELMTHLGDELQQQEKTTYGLVDRVTELSARVAALERTA